MSWDFLKSRGFWVAISATVTAALTILGVDSQTIALVVTTVASWAAFFVVTAARSAAGQPTGRAEVMRTLERQSAEIERLKGGA